MSLVLYDDVSKANCLRPRSYNRLRSIVEDSHFVAEVADAFGLPLVGPSSEPDGTPQDLIPNGSEPALWRVVCEPFKSRTGPGVLQVHRRPSPRRHAVQSQKVLFSMHLADTAEHRAFRANLHLLPLIVDSGGIIVVDSTRKGKVRASLRTACWTDRPVTSAEIPRRFVQDYTGLVRNPQ